MKKPKTRKPKPFKAGTFKHPYQLDLFGPQLASSMRDVGYLAKTAAAILLMLTFTYASYSTAASTVASLKSELLQGAKLLFGAFVGVAALEAMRNIHWIDFIKSRLVRPVLISINGNVFLYGLYMGLMLLAALQGAHEKNVEMDAKARTAERECIDQRNADVETAAKRRNSASAELKKCTTDFEQRPKGLFSQETVLTYCFAQRGALERMERNVKIAGAKICSTGSIKSP